MHFQRALEANPHDVDALAGLVDASLGRRDDNAAFDALQRLIAEAPDRTDARARFEMVRVRVAQSALTDAARAMGDGKLDEAEAVLARAEQASAGNPAVLRMLAQVAMARHRPDVAETRLREALGHDPQDPQSWSLLGDVLMATGRPGDAVSAFQKALAIAPTAADRQKLADARQGVSGAALPEPYRAIATATSVTRAQVAAVLGVRLASTLATAPSRNVEVLTDVRGHWAGQWVLSVIRAGWMEAMPNHTFQPGGVVTRAELARVMAAVLTDVASSRARELAQWRTARPAVVDVAAGHAAYPAIALVTAAGIMTTDAGRFRPAVVVSGADLLSSVARLEAMVK